MKIIQMISVMAIAVILLVVVSACPAPQPVVQEASSSETAATAEEAASEQELQEQRDAFAQESLDAYFAYLENTNALLENYGLTDSSGTVGQSLPVAYIPLDLLQVLGLPPSEYIKDTNIHWYPVFVNSQAETKIEIVDEDGEFAPGEFGGQHTAQAVVEALSALQELVDNPQDYTTKLVEVPALRATFLIGFENGKPAWAIPAMVSPGRFAIEENENFLQAGALYPIEEVIRALQNTAVNVDPQIIR